MQQGQNLLRKIGSERGQRKVREGTAGLWTVATVGAGFTALGAFASGLPGATMVGLVMLSLTALCAYKAYQGIHKASPPAQAVVLHLEHPHGDEPVRSASLSLSSDCSKALTGTEEEATLVEPAEREGEGEGMHL